MADNGDAMDVDERVFCHQCENEWRRMDHGLICPRCHSEFVEVIEENRDEPQDHEYDNPYEQPYGQPPREVPQMPNPFHNHNPWHDVPDPDEPDITTWEFRSGGPGRVTFARTSFRTNIRGHGRQRNADPMASVLTDFTSMINHMMAPPGNRPGQFRGGPMGGTVVFPQPMGGPGQPGMEQFGGRNAHNTTGRLWPRDANHPQPPGDPFGMLAMLLSGMEHQEMNRPGDRGGPAGNPLALFSQLLNPANAAHGDAVFTQEALDRVISQLMEQNAGSNAPGPASEAAIQALPKRQLDKTMMGDDGKAECSICMDGVEIGNEVTVLPCNHWFHDTCVTAWLKEHDTCPHCRQGITATPGEETRGQLPNRNRRPSSTQWSPAVEGSRRNPFIVPESPIRDARQRYYEGDGRRSDSARSDGSRRESDGRRRSTRSESHEGGSGSRGGGLAGWVRNRFGGGNN